MDDALLMLSSAAPMVDHAKGVYKAGRQYLDGCGGAMTVSIGHGVCEVIEAMHAQAKRVSFVYRTQFTNEAAQRLASELTAVAPGDINHAFFVNSGSEATELAMRAMATSCRISHSRLPLMISGSPSPETMPNLSERRHGTASCEKKAQSRSLLSSSSQSSVPPVVP